MEWLWGAVGGTLVGIVVSGLARPLTNVVNWLSEMIYGIDPIYVHVERDQQLVWANSPPWLSFAYAFRDGLPSEPLPPVMFDAWAWARRNGGVDMGLTMLQVTIQAKTDVSIVIEDVLIRNNRTDTRAAAGVILPAPGGADLNPRRLDVDLDEWDPPIVEFRLTPEEEPGPVPALQLGAGQVERFHIWVKADRGWNEWHIHMPLLVNGKRHDEFVGNARRPYVTAGWDVPAKTYRLAAADGGWEIYPVPPLPL